MTVADLPTRWRERAELLEPYTGAAATAYRNAAQELEEAERDRDVSSAVAAELSGYSRRQLRRLVAEGKLKNVGTGNEHRYRVAELPRKPGHRVPAAEGPSSKGQIARAVARGENG